MLKSPLVRRTTLLALVLALLSATVTATQFEERDIKRLLKQSGCYRCHAEDREKDGPSYRKIADEHRGEPDIQAKLARRVTITETVEIKGKKENHDPLRTRDKAEVKAAVQWILTR